MLRLGIVRIKCIYEWDYICTASYNTYNGDYLQRNNIQLHQKLKNLDIARSGRQKTGNWVAEVFAPPQPY